MYAAPARHTPIPLLGTETGRESLPLQAIPDPQTPVAPIESQ